MFLSRFSLFDKDTLKNKKNMASLPPGAQVQPIDSITPFLNGRWWIKARMTDKSDIRTWNKPTGSGKLFSFTLVDQSSAIRATAFNETVDQLFPMLQPGNVYYFSGGQVKNANRKFSNVNNDYELTFDKTTQVVPARNDAESMSIPVQRYNFVPIKILQQREVGSLVDVLAVVMQTGELSNLVQKATGKELTKRSIKIADSTASIELTLWDEGAKNWNIPTGSIVAFRQCRTGAFDGVTLGTTQQTTFDTNPNIPDTKKLSDWFHATGGNDVSSLSNQGTRGGEKDSENFRGRKFFEDIQTERLGRGINADFIDVRCTPVYLKTDGQWYDACPTPKCNKKVVPVGASGNQFKCEKCDREVVPIQRYLVSLQASDNVQQLWLTMFNETAEEFLGITAQELKKRSEADPSYITKVAQSRLHRPLLMRIRVKEERQGNDGDDRTRLTVTKVTEILPIERIEGEKRPTQGNLKDEIKHLLDSVAAY
ncbi:replication factor 51kDa, putative [Bodo saltans]|uniref:Replication protein A subunit n=1 Tax=Bodo saltans TaxID=75058 RepID=A0A0S4J8L0_BODSA|nr:replication factor 51kDa, putative [Bodo saltans]|eukprot:CUG87758.1 replication factor 51kDa, putative [Bodo saltans]